MLALAQNLSISPRWRSALRAGVMATALVAVAGAPLAAQAREWDHRGHGGYHDRYHGWHHPAGWGYYAPYGGPLYGYNTYAPGYGYYAPGASLNFTIR
jgi:hypothetical protein